MLCEALPLDCVRNFQVPESIKDAVAVSQFPVGGGSRRRVDEEEDPEISSNSSTVDRLGQPSAEVVARSTGPVDRCVR